MTAKALPIIAALALAVAGCSVPGAGTEGSDNGGASDVLSMGIPNDITGREVDPFLTAGGTAIPFLYSLYEPLYAFDANGEPKPNVVESDELSDDERTLTLKIRAGQTFHDDSTLDSEDVAFSLDRARGADETLDGPTSTSSLSSIESVEATDPETVIIHLSRPDPVLRHSLAYLSGMVLPSDYVQEVGNDGFLKHPIGSGPYAFDRATQGQTVRLTAFDDNVFDPAPAYDAVELQVLQEGATRISQLRSGDIDFAVDVAISQIDALESEGLTVTTNPSGQVLSILFNSKTEALEDPRVRQAFNYAVDVEAIVQKIYRDKASVSPSNDVTLTTKDLGPIGYDPDRAKELLKEAGFDTSTPLAMNYPSGRYPQDQQLMQTIQANLSEVGVKVDLRPLDSNQWLDKLRSKSLDDMTLTLNSNLNYDPYQSMWAGTTCEGPWSLWCDKDFDTHLEKVAKLSGQERREAFTAISKNFAADPPAIFLVDYHQVYAMQEGIEWTPTPGIRNFDYTQIRPTS